MSTAETMAVLKSRRLFPQGSQSQVARTWLLEHGFGQRIMGNADRAIGYDWREGARSAPIRSASGSEALTIGEVAARIKVLQAELADCKLADLKESEAIQAKLDELSRLLELVEQWARWLEAQPTLTA